MLELPNDVVVAVHRRGNEYDGRWRRITETPPAGTRREEDPLTSVLSCPSCQEEDALHGEHTDAGIRIRCGRCHAEWMRDTAPRCATCGRGDIATRPRPLTQYSRGTQLSIVGWLDVPCCVHCDAEALTKSTGAGAPLPPDYRPAAMHPRPEEDPAAATAPTPHDQPTGDR